MSGKELDRMTSYTEGNRSRMDQTGSSGSFSSIFLDKEMAIDGDMFELPSG